MKQYSLTRRFFMKTTAAIATLSIIPKSIKAMVNTVKEKLLTKKQMTSVDVTINNKNYQLEIDSRTTLLDLLRENLQLTGTKKGCDHGQCGACTVHVNGQRELSCLTLAALASGKEITTIEGLADGNQLHPMQEAFIEMDGFQCGYCTPGQIMSAVACVDEGRTESVEEIKEYMSGNLCRCGAYNGIVEAIQKVAK